MYAFQLRNGTSVILFMSAYDVTQTQSLLVFIWYLFVTIESLWLT